MAMDQDLLLIQQNAFIVQCQTISAQEVLSQRLKLNVLGIHTEAQILVSA
jgi:hypothetical protein